MHTSYNNRKNGVEDITFPLPNLEDILGDSYGTIIYQEHCMLISKKVANFDDNQADSYLRKALAKGDIAKMELCKQWLIYGKVNEEAPIGYDISNTNQVMYDPKGKYGAPILGGINNNYKEDALILFWEMLKDYASYLFNKSHATSYSLLTNIIAWLKRYYPVEFFASVLTLLTNEEKQATYISILEKQYDIKVTCPDINISGSGFTPLPEENKILYGLSSIKGVGDKSVPEIIENRPYNTLDELLTKVSKKACNKTVGQALIKSGALDFIDNNRNQLINMFFDLRKDKDERLNEEEYDEKKCMEYEINTLQAPITYKPWFDKYKVNDKIEFECDILSLREKTDKNGGLMAFAKVISDGIELECVIFSKLYKNMVDVFDEIDGKRIWVKGIKNDKNKIIVKSSKKSK